MTDVQKEEDLGLKPWDAADYLKTPDAIAVFLEDSYKGAIEDDAPKLFDLAVEDACRAVVKHGLAQCKPTGFVDLLSLLGLKLKIRPAKLDRSAA